MKENKLYAVCYVSGYTSDASIQVFTNKKDAEKEFDILIRNTFGKFLDTMNQDEDNLSYPSIFTMDKEHLKDKYDIHIDGLFDITWDGDEVYERVYLEDIKAK
jgi:hypothetical protein